MRAPREVRQWVNKQRRKHARRFGVKNGVLPCCVWDCLEIEIKWAKSDRQRHRRSRSVADEAD